jgi:anti-sigma factor RsiW
MNHMRAAALLSAYADGQVNPIRRMLLRRHYDRCPSCLAQLEALQTTRAAIRANLQTHRAPPGLASRIASALPREAVAPPPRRPSRLVMGFGASGLAGALAGVAMTLLLTQPQDPLVGDVVADHVRSLMADHLTDVLTSDQHTVKPWLSARLPLSPVVKDLATDGYPLVGGRLDYVEGNRAAALVYRRAKHVINLFAFAAPGPEETAPTHTAKDGFNVVRWRMGGLTYIAVSDVELPQLQTFVHLVSAGD